MNEEMALFIDFENIRYSLINVQRREPDPQELIAVARHFGTVMVARAYADWTRQPEFFKGSLTAAMIDRVDCPAKVRERFRQTSYQPLYGHQAAYERPYDRPYPRENDLPEEEEREEYLPEALDEHEEPAAEGEMEAAEEQLAEEPGQGYEQDDRRGRLDPAYTGPIPYYQQPQPVITQSTVDLNMLMDIIETVFDRPTINTFVLMTGDRDFTRICARLKLRLNKRVVVVGVPGTVSRDLISAAEQFVPLGVVSGPLPGGAQSRGYPSSQYAIPSGPVEIDEPGFIHFLDYIDRHWSWRTVGGVANFIGDAFNPKNRFRGRLTRDSARDLLRACIDDSILIVSTDSLGGENLRLNREHPAVATVLRESTQP